MELFRTLGALFEPPRPELEPLAELLEMGSLPDVAEHSDLFLFQLYPYASVYLDAAGMLGGEARDRIAGFWRALAFEPPQEPDHLSILLAFHAELADKASRSTGDEAAAWQRALRAFLWEHLLSWLPFFAVTLQHLASPFYGRLGKILTRALESEVDLLGTSPDLPLHLREAPAMVDPRTAPAADFFSALLSPVRSGMILTRDDLSRAARQLEMGTRIGERRFVLQALLGQDPAATLVWLAEEARAQEAAWLALGPYASPAAGFWAERAAASSSLLEALSQEASTAVLSGRHSGSISVDQT